MKRTTAERLMVHLEAIGNEMNAMTLELEEIADPVIKKEIKHALGTMMAYHWEVMRPILRCHPELDPDQRPYA